MAEVKFTGDFSQIKKELDSIQARVDRLAKSFENASKKWGQSSPQATMSKHAFDRALADLDKKLSDLSKQGISVTRSGEQPSSSGPRGGISTPGSPANNQWRFRVEQEQFKYYRSSNQIFARMGNVAYGTASGLLNFSTGGGLGSLAKGIEQGFTRSISRNNAWAALFAGATMGRGGGGGRKIVGSAASSGATEGAEGASLEEVAGAAAGASGLAKAARILPGLIKFLVGITVGIGAAELTAMDKFTVDVWKRSRRAEGFGTGMGQMTAFETFASRYIDNPDNVLKASQQAMFDITSPAYTAMRIAGLDPAKWHDASQLSEAGLIQIQEKLKGFKDRETMLTLAKKGFKFNALGLSDEDLIRLYTGDQNAAKDIAKRAQQEAPFMGMNKDQIKAYQDLYVETSTAATELKTFGEILETAAIPLLKDFDNTIEDIAKYRGPDKSFTQYQKESREKVSVEDAPILKFLEDHFGNIGSTVSDVAAGTIVGEMLGAGGGGRRGVYSRTTKKSNIRFPSGGGARGRGDAGFGLNASDIGLVASKGLPAEEAAFLDTIGTGETKRGSYSEGSGDPGGLGGRYQFLLSTWNKEAAKAGVNPKDFSPENQDKVAWFYANEVVRQKTGKDLMTLLKSGPGGVSQAIEALTPGAWNAIGRIDPDKIWHSGAVKLYRKKLQDEQKNQNPTGPTSMNNMNNFQTKTHLAMTIHNAAGANYAVHGGMLGNGSGSFGRYG